jgi:D-serine deaminase-like pyridoxal phosphate-dependent protein
MIGTKMAAHNAMLSEYPWDPQYAVSRLEDVITPALVIYPEIVASNIMRTLELLGGDPERWRVHIKTAKLGYTVRMLVERGIRNFKCATTLELLTACRCGAADVLVAYPTMGANARRVREIAAEFPGVRVSVLAENDEQVRQWKDSRLGIFLDINSGMNRTGVEDLHTGEVVKLTCAIGAAGLEFRGLHYYDGHHGGLQEPERTVAAHEGYDRLMKIVAEVKRDGMDVAEVITAGTPTFPCALSYARFRDAGFAQRVSPGTVVYGDATNLAQLPTEYGYRAAALVVTRVVSRPRPGIVTCDAGHKAVSADAGVPTCVVVGHSELTPLTPSEEHLPLAVEGGVGGPQAGEALYLMPRHVCPTVNNFDDALMVRNGAIESVEKVSARGHETPLFSPADATFSLRGK